MSVAVECRLYMVAIACRWFSGGCVPRDCELVPKAEPVTTENSESGRDEGACEKSDSLADASLLGGRSISDPGCSSTLVVSSLASFPDMRRASPTKQHRVFISSTIASVRTPWGTRVARFAAGTLMAALREEGGGR